MTTAPATFTDRTALLARLAAFFERRPEVRFAYLFGSRARGDGNARSDVDVAVLTEGVDPKAYAYGYRVELWSDLALHLGTERLDVVDLREAPPFLRHQVLRDGIVILSRDEPARNRFAVEAFGAYDDWMHLHAIKMLYLRQIIREGRFGLP